MSVFSLPSVEKQGHTALNYFCIELAQEVFASKIFS